MRDNLLYSLIATQIGALAPLRGVSSAPVMLRYQPAQQGRPSEQTVWMHQVLKRPVGTPLITYPQGGGERVEEAKETTLQFSVTRPSARTPDDLTHSDILDRIRSTVQSRAFMAKILPQGVSVLRVESIRNTPFLNDRDEWEEGPVFDLIVKHSDIWLDAVEDITVFEFELIAVPNLAA